MARALVGLVEKMPRRKPPMVEDDGPELEGPPADEEPRGGADGETEEELEHEEAGEEHGHYDKHFEMALDDVADIVGVTPEDRADFGTAMKALIHCVIGDALQKTAHEEEEEVDEEEGEPEEEEGEPEEEEHEPAEE